MRSAVVGRACQRRRCSPRPVRHRPGPPSFLALHARRTSGGSRPRAAAGAETSVPKGIAQRPAAWRADFCRLQLAARFAVLRRLCARPAPQEVALLTATFGEPSGRFFHERETPFRARDREARIRRFSSKVQAWLPACLDFFRWLGFFACGYVFFGSWVHTEPRVFILSRERFFFG